MPLAKVRVLMLTGWGVGLAPLNALKHGLSQRCEVDVWEIFDPTDVAMLQEKVAAAKHYDVLLGWSLGGQLALILGHEIAKQTGIAKPMICCMSNPCFVAHASWTTAMPVLQFQQFSSLLQQDSIRGIQRFCHLVSLGGTQAKSRATALFQQLDINHFQQQVAYLSLLEQLNLVGMLENYAGQRLHIFAKQDVLVPYQIIENTVFLKQNTCKVILLEGAHLAIETEAEQLLPHLLEFIAFTVPCLNAENQNE